MSATQRYGGQRVRSSINSSPASWTQKVLDSLHQADDEGIPTEELLLSIRRNGEIDDALPMPRKALLSEQRGSISSRSTTISDGSSRVRTTPEEELAVHATQAVATTASSSCGATDSNYGARGTPAGGPSPLPRSSKVSRKRVRVVSPTPSGMLAPRRGDADHAYSSSQSSDITNDDMSDAPTTSSIVRDECVTAAKTVLESAPSIHNPPCASSRIPRLQHVDAQAAADIFRGDDDDEAEQREVLARYGRLTQYDFGSESGGSCASDGGDDDDWEPELDDETVQLFATMAAKGVPTADCAFGAVVVRRACLFLNDP